MEKLLLKETTSLETVKQLYEIIYWNKTLNLLFLDQIEEFISERPEFFDNCKTKEVA